MNTAEGGRVRRFALVVVAAALMLPAPGWGACACREPGKPDLPPNHADAREMEQAGKDITRYVAKMKEYRSCLANCVGEADASLSAYIEGWNQAVDEFNARTGVPEGRRSPAE